MQKHGDSEQLAGALVVGLTLWILLPETVSGVVDRYDRLYRVVCGPWIWLWVESVGTSHPKEQGNLVQVFVHYWMAWLSEPSQLLEAEPLLISWYVLSYQIKQSLYTSILLKSHFNNPVIYTSVFQVISFLELFQTQLCICLLLGSCW